MVMAAGTAALRRAMAPGFLLMGLTGVTIA